MVRFVADGSPEFRSWNIRVWSRRRRMVEMTERRSVIVSRRNSEAVKLSRRRRQLLLENDSSRAGADLDIRLCKLSGPWQSVISEKYY